MARLIFMLFFMIGISFGQIAPEDTLVKKEPPLNYIASVGGIKGIELFCFNPSLSRVLPVSLYLQKFDIQHYITFGLLLHDNGETYEGKYLMYEMHKLTPNPKGYSVGGLAGVGLTRYLIELPKRKSGIGIMLSTGLIFQKSPFILEARTGLRPGATKSHVFFTLNSGLGTKSLIGSVGAHAIWVIPLMVVISLVAFGPY